MGGGPLSGDTLFHVPSISFVPDRAGSRKHPQLGQDVLIGNVNAGGCQAMEFAVATFDEEPAVHVLVCELCVQIMTWNMRVPDQVIGICPECHRDIPE